MCLTIKSSDKVLVQKVYKCLQHRYMGLTGTLPQEWITPYQYACIPDNGILIAGEKIDKSYGDIHGGVIHSFKSKQKLLNCTTFIAYALDVRYQGHGNDIASKILYIPALDKRKKKNDNTTVAKLKQCKTLKEVKKVLGI